MVCLSLYIEPSTAYYSQYWYVDLPVGHTVSEELSNKKVNIL